MTVLTNSLRCVAAFAGLACRVSRNRLARPLVWASLVAVMWAVSLSAQAAPAEWRPTLAERRFDIQLTEPLNLSRPADVLALELFGTGRERLERLRVRNVATVCHIAAGIWENWRPDARDFPQAALGRSPTGWYGQRWLDPRHPALRSILEKRLDLCRARGFDGVLFAGLDGYVRDSGFNLRPDDQLAFDRWLAAAAHARGLAAGILGAGGLAPQLASLFDFLVEDRCVAEGDCTATKPFLEAGRPVYLIAYTNNERRARAYCDIAAETGAPLILKTQFANGKLHRRCP